MTAPDDLARTRLYDEIADALGAMPEAYNIRDITDEETTMLPSMPVEQIAAHLASVVSRRDADLRTRIDRHWRREIERALREADWPEDEMAMDDDIARYEGRREAVEIAREMLQLDADTHEDAPPVPYEQCVLNSDGKCTRWSHDHTADTDTGSG